MIRILAFAALLLALAAPARAEMGPCARHESGEFMLCGKGNGSAFVIRNTVSPSQRLALAWRDPNGLPTEETDREDIELLIVRLSDGAILATSKTEFWDTGERHVNRLEERAAWSPDSKLMIRHFHSRFSTDTMDLYAFDKDDKTGAPLDLLDAISKAVRAQVKKRGKEIDDYSFTLAWTENNKEPLKIDNRGRIRASVMLWVPKNGPFYYFDVTAQLMRSKDKLSAKIISARLTKREGREN